MLFNDLDQFSEDFELALSALVQARPTERKTPGLKMILAAEGKTTGNPQMAQMKGEGKDG